MSSSTECETLLHKAETRLADVMNDVTDTLRTCGVQSLAELIIVHKRFAAAVQEKTKEIESLLDERGVIEARVEKMTKNVQELLDKNREASAISSKQHNELVKLRGLYATATEAVRIANAAMGLPSFVGIMDKHQQGTFRAAVRTLGIDQEVPTHAEA